MTKRELPSVLRQFARRRRNERCATTSYPTATQFIQKQYARALQRCIRKGLNDFRLHKEERLETNQKSRENNPDLRNSRREAKADP
mmetsp:Transcript_116330/g.336039  ORF Transcript_116330/g.336039 Transcript_116330/m.336039 type:complete len:86 (+) Transcript_116330:1461-1718(+)